MSDIPARFITESYSNTFDEYEESNINVLSEEIYEECDMFIELGDSMFYVSEYHNALFDDPDAHDEAINEYGILLDSYDDEIVQEAAYGPYDEYLKKHGYDPKSNTIEDPERPGKRVSVGRIGSEKERRRMNRFLRENGYDPKTETIQTDVNDPKNKGSKKRIKFTMDPHRPTSFQTNYYDDYIDDSTINVSKQHLQKKPHISNYLLKHEEGHVNQRLNYGNLKKRIDVNNRDGWLEKPTSKEDKSRMASAKQYLGRLKSSGEFGNFGEHEQKVREFEADAYSATHNPHDRKGDAIKFVSNDLKRAEQTRVQNKIRSYERVINSLGISDMIGKRGFPDQYTRNDEWIERLAECSTKAELFKTYLSRTKINSQIAEINDEMDDIVAHQPITNEDRQRLDAMRQRCRELRRQYDAAKNSEKEILAIVKKCKDYLKLLKDLELERGESGERNNARFEAGMKAREDFYQKHHDKQQKAVQAAERKRRQLSKEQLKQQIDSGKLTKDQLSKAKRKLQRIEQFEKSQRK